MLYQTGQLIITDRSVTKAQVKAIGGKLVIRVDCGTTMGIGHLMRCLALAQAWQEERGKAVFVSASTIPDLEGQLQSEGIDVLRIAAHPGGELDARETAAVAQRLGATWIVLDGYHFGSQYQRLVKSEDKRLLYIDDSAEAGEYVADLVLNQNLGASPEWYPHIRPGTRLLLGITYALLRREFRQLALQRSMRDAPELARNILVTLGGADPDKVTLKVIEALRRLSGHNLNAVVVIGGGNCHAEEIRQATRNCFDWVRIETNVAKMSELMAWADLAISAGGVTSLELAFMGLPALLLVLADNQRGNAESLDKSGVCVNLGWHDTVSTVQLVDALKCLRASKPRRAAMSHAGKRLVDGEGAKRVALGLKDQC